MESSKFFSGMCNISKEFVTGGGYNDGYNDGYCGDCYNYSNYYYSDGYKFTKKNTVNLPSWLVIVP